MTRFGRFFHAGSVPRSRVLWIAAGALVVLGAAGAALLSGTGGEEGSLGRRDVAVGGEEESLGRRDVAVGGERWRVVIAAKPRRAARGAGVEVRLAVTNTSDSAPQGLNFSTTRQFVLVARDERGRVAWRVAHPERKLTITRSVGPGAAVTYVQTWPTRDDAAGRYSVEGQILDPDLRSRSRVRTSAVLE